MFLVAVVIQFNSKIIDNSKLSISSRFGNPIGTETIEFKFSKYHEKTVGKHFFY